MRQHPLAVTAVILLGALPASAAEAASASGWEVAFRASVAFPAGDVASNAGLSQVVGVQFPLTLDVGYRLDEHFVLGLTGQYAFGTFGSLNCTDCWEGGGQVGLQFQAHPLGRAKVDPWFGVGVSYEWLILGSSGAGSSTGSIGGFDFLVVTGGVEFAVGSVRLGPFVGFTLGEYEYASPGGAIDQKALHFWLSAGLKLTLFP